MCIRDRVGTRDARLRLRLLQLRLLQRVVQLDQQLAAAHSGPFRKAQLADAAADLRPQHHTLGRLQRAHGLHIVDQGLDFGPGNFHRGRATRRAHSSRAGTGSGLGLAGFGRLDRSGCHAGLHLGAVLPPPCRTASQGHADDGHQRVNLLQVRVPVQCRKPSTVTTLRVSSRT